MFPVFNYFSETPCMKVGLDVRMSLVRVLSTGGSFPQNVSSSPPPPKCLIFPPAKNNVFPEKNWKLFQILILFDDDIKESVKATNVQKCHFSQS